MRKVNLSFSFEGREHFSEDQSEAIAAKGKGT
jgi:hypothetical protein